MKKRAVVLLLAFGLIWATSGSAAATHGGPFGTATAGCNVNGGFVILNGLVFGGGYDSYRLDQTFTPSRSGQVLSAHLKGVGRSGVSSVDPDFIVRIMTVDNSGVPTDTVLTSVIIPGSDVPNSGTFDLVANFPTDAPVLVQGQMYSLAVTLSQTDDTQVSWQADSNNPCAGGQGYWDKTPIISGNPSWDFRYDVYTAPADLFANRQPLAGLSPTVQGTTSGATREPNEPDHYIMNPPDSDLWVGDHSVWYEWTAPSTGPASADVCTAAIDSIVAVYTGSDLASLNRIAENNNGAQCPEGTFGSYLTFDAVKGTSYNIAVGDAGGARENTFTLAIQGHNAPPVVTPIKPVPGSQITNRTPLVKAQVTDELTNLRKKNIKLLFDGNQRRGFDYNRTTDLLTWETPRLAGGRHRVKVVATDPQGLIGKKRWSFRLVP